MKNPTAPITSGGAAHLQVPALLAAVLLVGANAFVLSPLLSEVATGLNTQPYRIAWSISVFGAATAISSLTLAGLIDRMPAGRILGGAAILLALAEMASAASQSWLWLALAQAVAGIATGILLPGTYATAAATAPKGREAGRMGMVLTGWAMALVMAVPLAAVVADRFGWRLVYILLAALSAIVAILLTVALRKVQSNAMGRTQPWNALRLPGVAPLLIVMFTYMTAFYGSFAFFGEGVREAFELSTGYTGTYILAYGLGFGLAGIVISIATPQISRGYIMTILVAITASYACWRFALATKELAFVAAVIWGALNQLGLNALVVSLNRCAADTRGAVMGLNSAVTYSAVFAGPLIMGPLYHSAGFPAVSSLAAVLVAIGALVSWRKF